MNKIDEKTLIPVSILGVLAGAIMWATWLHTDIKRAKEDIILIAQRLEKIDDMNSQISVNSEDINFLQGEIDELEGMERRLIQIETKIDLIYQRMSKK